jgi:hypothetical protein
MLILLLSQALQTDLLPEAMATFQMRIWADLAPLLAHRLVASRDSDDLVAVGESLAAAGHPLLEAVPETSSEISWESLPAVLEQLGPEASWKGPGAIVKQISLAFAWAPLASGLRCGSSWAMTHRLQPDLCHGPGNGKDYSIK